MQHRPDISNTLLWEYDIPNFHWDKSYKIVIERVLIMGDIKEWQEIYKFYGREKIIETINWSKQLSGVPVTAFLLINNNLLCNPYSLKFKLSLLQRDFFYRFNFLLDIH